MSSTDDTLPRPGTPLDLDGLPVAIAKAAVLDAMFGPDKAGESSRVQLGRYALGERLGAGASGTVYQARDEALQRDVAVKVLPPQYRGAPIDRRYLEEARAIAALTDPHVVQVFDTGVTNGVPYIAMELVDGGSLDAWLREPRTVEAIVAAFIDAGRGLAAAHAAGLVHRDFKPANVLIDAAGRARVADFGLASLLAPTLADDGSEVTTLSDEASLQLTRTGAIVGTPAFMAPEQHRGEAVGAAADQYAFCASLHGALYGTLPFSGDSLADLHTAKQHRRLTLPTAASRYPWLDAIIARGLAPEPEDRWPSMEAVVEALRRGPRRRRGAIGMAAVVGLGLLGWWAVPTTPDACRDVAADLDEVYDEARSSGIDEHLRAIGQAHAWPRIDDRLQTYADAWRVQRRDVCDGAASQVPADDALRCLRRARARLDGALTSIEALSTEDGSAAVDLVTGVGRLACTSAVALQTPDPRPTDPEIAGLVEGVRDAFAALLPRLNIGATERDAADLAALMAQADAIGYAPLQAELVMARGYHHIRAGDIEAAIADQLRAHELAAEHGHDAVAAETAIVLYGLYGARARDEAEADRWGAAADAVLRRLGDPPRLRVQYEDRASTVAAARGETDDALAHAQRAVDGAAALDPPEPRLFAATAQNLAEALRRAGQPRQAIDWAEKGLAALVEELGADHRIAIGTRYTYALALSQLGERTRAKETLDETLATAHRVLGPTHPWIAAMENEAGNAALRDRDPAAARGHFERGLSAAEAAQGLERAQYIDGIAATLAQALSDLGEHEQAAAQLARSLQSGREFRREDDPVLLLRRCLRATELHAAGDVTGGRDGLETCRTAAIEAGAGDVEAIASFDLARIIAPEDPTRARELAEQAQQLWRRDGDEPSVTRPYPGTALARIEQVQTWLAEQAPPPSP